MDHLQTVENILDAIRRGHAGDYASYFAEGARLEHPLSPEPVVGRDAIRQSEAALFDAFSAIEVDVRALLTDGNHVVAEVVLRATNTGAIHLGDEQPIPATGKQVEVPAVWLFEFGASGAVESERDYFDTAAFLAQLGLHG